ncbi:MDIS1-interacting receptor like kinase [Sesamum angolense]|uniref:non-specific serine/threonine protein kinase n=1 Tax=Sesamum angolense TaxID=2727404 RepID=A0AAE1W732_9LAMI|nr:MDIS1-interacting receptor like kinase [Sesamum angolense]
MASSFAVCFPIISTAILLLILAPSQTTTANTEAEALISSGWSSRYTRNISDHCKWAGVACDDAGHVVEIARTTTVPIGAWLGGLLDKLNFLAFPHLVRIDLRALKLYGTIHIQIGILSQLTYLDLSDNNLTGAIPTQIGALSTLTYLDLSSNSFTGAIPAQIGSLSKLTFLHLSRNHITGEVPLDVGKLSQLSFLDLSRNNLSGVIPFQIASLPLKKIDLSQNFFHGIITCLFGSIGPSGYHKVLIQVNLSHNNLSGPIPLALLELDTIDLSYNAFEGPIPIDIRCEKPKCVLFPNAKLFNYSGSVTPSNKEESHRNYTTIFVSIAVFFGLLFLGGGFFLLKIKAKKSNQEPLVTNEGDLFKIWNFNGKIAYEDIVKATEDFEISYCIGTGGYGSVYRAELPNGRVVALKKLHRMEGENPTYDKCFRNEAKILQGIKHQNIVRLFGYCLHKRCMFLIYEYMERGSLFCILRDENEAVELIG